MMQAILFALATWFVPSAALEAPFVGSSFWLGLELRSLKLISSVGEFESDIASTQICKGRKGGSGTMIGPGQEGKPPDVSEAAI